MIKIYLAGCKGDWRETVHLELCDRAVLFDPFRDSRQGVIGEFTADDLEAVKNCDLVIFYHAYHVFDGSALECGYAHALGKPIVYVCKEPRASSMICAVSAAVFTDLLAALEWTRSHYLRVDPESRTVKMPAGGN
jgi:nucleoside 2-deoxyribosyltransferase